MTEADDGRDAEDAADSHRAPGRGVSRRRSSAQFEGPVIDLLAPIDHTLADTQIGVAFGITTLPHLKDLSIVGPYQPTGVSETPSRRKVFTLPPDDARRRKRRARSEIVRRLGGAGVSRSRCQRDDFDRAAALLRGRPRRSAISRAGIAAAIEAILASPQFLFRLEPTRAAARPARAYRIGDRELASRLSFFLWGAAPDESC